MKFTDLFNVFRTFSIGICDKLTQLIEGNYHPICGFKFIVCLCFSLGQSITIVLIYFHLSYVGLATPMEMKLKLVPIFQYMYHDTESATKVINFTRQFNPVL